ncbi:conserved hypothetical protein [Gloeothece citriformis PCC 7424]|uniref:Type I restriction enzyme R protein N-terminal domain-containing protein n=1 Tax=Gloeothece citriformis (strain PCC 7424) TaxID=65393 RepID=B7KDN7_GLOC7|nr:hypothetical protein [Gloeothece citriformis]ACK70339.1 conserved hypothetical protein [Gloeothece citriformis PCC 7424]
MPFSSYKTIGAVAKEFQIQYRSQEFIEELAFPVPVGFKEELELLFTDGVVDNSEDAICENLIYPVLKEVWKYYRHKFTLWSHQTLVYDANLLGQPDYILAKRSPLGTIIFDQPYFLVIEAKQDKFEEGWGQCLAELVAVQKINHLPEQTLFGIVSNGKIWQFGKLNLDSFTLNKTFYTIQNLEQLFSVVNYVFKQCELQLDSLN